MEVLNILMSRTPDDIKHDVNITVIISNCHSNTSDEQRA